MNNQLLQPQQVPQGKPLPHAPIRRLDILLVMLFGLVMLGVGFGAGYFSSANTIQNVSKRLNQQVEQLSPKVEQRNLITRQETKTLETQTSISKLVNYTLLPGWKLDEKNFSYKYIFFMRLDNQYNEDTNFLQQGAGMSIQSDKNTKGHSLKEYVDSYLSNIENDTYDYPITTVDGLSGLNAFVCWEGCGDMYFFQKDNYFIRVSFFCAPKCKTKSELDKSIYAKERDKFLNSLKFN